MACGLRSDVGVSSPSQFGISLNPKSKKAFGLCASVVNPHLSFKGRQLLVPDLKKSSNWSPSGAPTRSQIYAQASLCVSKAQMWWEKSTMPNMVQIESAQQLVSMLITAGDRLVIVEFYSPGCGGCRALHPKICQLAESNPDAIFLKVNYEDLKKMCQALHIHVLPFFRVYRGADGKVGSFSCTNATIKKLKDALEKYGSDRPSFGPAKGLDEFELVKLASIGEISLDSTPNKNEERIGDLIKNRFDLSSAWTRVRLAGEGIYG